MDLCADDIKKEGRTVTKNSGSRMLANIPGLYKEETVITGKNARESGVFAGSNPNYGYKAGAVRPISSGRPT